MRFSNPASDAKAVAPAYTKALLDLLGDRDPLRLMAEFPAVLEKAVAGLGEDVLRRREAPGRWSILEVVHHLADSEIVYGYRVRAVLTEKEPVLAGYDQDAWANVLRYNESDLEAALAQLRVLRRANLRLVGSLDRDALERVGFHPERGRESVAHILKLLAAHDLVHLAQIERIRKAVGETG